MIRVALWQRKDAKREIAVSALGKRQRPSGAARLEDGVACRHGLPTDIRCRPARQAVLAVRGSPPRERTTPVACPLPIRVYAAAVSPHRRKIPCKKVVPRRSTAPIRIVASPRMAPSAMPMARVSPPRPVPDIETCVRAVFYGTQMVKGASYAQANGCRGRYDAPFGPWAGKKLGSALRKAKHGPFAPSSLLPTAERVVAYTLTLQPRPIAIAVRPCP